MQHQVNTLMYRVSKIPHIFFQFSQQKILNVFSMKMLQKNKMSHQPPAGPLCEVSISCWSPFMYVKQLPALGNVNCSQARHQNSFLIPLRERAITQSCPVGGGVNERKCIIFIYYWDNNNIPPLFFAFPVYKSFYTSENVFLSTLIRDNVIIVTWRWRDWGCKKIHISRNQLAKELNWTPKSSGHSPMK